MIVAEGGRRNIICLENTEQARSRRGGEEEKKREKTREKTRGEEEEAHCLILEANVSRLARGRAAVQTTDFKMREFFFIYSSDRAGLESTILKHRNILLIS